MYPQKKSQNRQCPERDIRRENLTLKQAFFGTTSVVLLMSMSNKNPNKLVVSAMCIRRCVVVSAASHPQFSKTRITHCLMPISPYYSIAYTTGTV